MGTREPKPLLVAPEWVEAHCVVPDRFAQGQPFRLYDQQLSYLANFYLVRGTAKWTPANPLLASAFVYRRGLWVGPQKLGKGPGTAAQICLEGMGPSLFAGWAGPDDGYACTDWGCGCGWEYPYQPGEPMGMPRPTPLIQVTAYSQDQTDSVYDRALRPMIELGPLSDVAPRTGEEFIRLPGGGKVETVTASAPSRLGQPVTFVPQDEVGIYTESNGMLGCAETQWRNLAGMGGRASMTTNAWNPAEQSVAQRQSELAMPDLYVQHRQPPAHLSYTNKVERRRIHRHVYGETAREHGGHVDLEQIEAEAAELVRKDPAQAERFYGNRVVYGSGSWLPSGLWPDTRADRKVLAGTPICLGFDGSDVSDYTAIRAETRDGHRFTPTYGPDNSPTIWNPTESGDRIPRSEVHAAVDELFARFRVQRMYCDPPYWRTEIDEWSARYGAEKVLLWDTGRVKQMHAALERARGDLATGLSSHDSCPITAVHVANARMVARPGQHYLLGKPSAGQKIDAAMADALAHEAAADARREGWETERAAFVPFRVR